MASIEKNNYQAQNNAIPLYEETIEHDENRARYFAQSRLTTARHGVAPLPPRPAAHRNLTPPTLRPS